MQFELTHLVDALPELGWTALPDGRAEFLNRRWLEFTGLTAERATGGGWIEAIHPDDRARLVEHWRACLTAGTPVDAEARMRRYDGAYRWFLLRANPVRDAAGQISRWFGTCIDIEDRRRHEETLRARETSWRQIVDNIPGLVATMGARGEVEFLNRQTLEYFGKTNEELKDWSLNGAVHPDDLPGVIEARVRCIETGQPYQVEHRCLGADGIYRWFQVRGLPVRAATGEIVNWYLLLTDIEDRKKVEEAWRSNERNLSSIVNSIPNPIHVLRTDGSVLYSNQGVLDYTGLTQEEVQQESYRSRVIHPEDLPRTNTLRREGLLKSQPFEYELRVLGKDGEYRWFVMRLSPLLDEQGRVDRWSLAAFDIDALKRAEHDLNRARSELAQVSRVTTLNTLTASIAHEVNQPLTGIITNASTCLRMLAAQPPKCESAAETVRRILRDGNRAAEVISHLRALFGRKEFKPELLDLNEATREVIALSLSDLRAHRVILRSDLADDLPRIRGDRVQLQQVILNMVRNASEAMAEVEDRPRELHIVTATDAARGVLLSVKDSGAGFGPEVADKLFDAFFTTKSDGMGIGLSVSRSIIEAHQGQLTASANQGPGATFCFSVPASAIAGQAAR